MAASTVLVISNDPDMGALVGACLQMEGFRVVPACGADLAIAQLLQARPDVVVFDVDKPSAENWQAVVRIRDLAAAPLVLLSSQAQPSDLTQDPDDEGVCTVQKPFGLQTLAGAVRASIQQVASAAGRHPAYDDGYLCIDLSRGQVCVAGAPVHLTPIEQRLLACLLRRAGTLVTHQELLRSGWGWSGEGSSIWLHVLIRSLRQKLERDPRRPEYIPIEGEAGYRFQGQSPTLPDAEPNGPPPLTE